MIDSVKPIMAIDPYKDKMVNVEPLFSFLRYQSDIDKRVDDILRIIVLSMADREENNILLNEFGCWSDMYLFIYDLRDMFAQLSECEISISKKKGVSQ